MTVSNERRQLIINLAVEGLRGDGVGPDGLSEALQTAYFEAQFEEVEAFCREIPDPEELRLFAEMWNWDYGHEPLEAILNNPACDAGTALMIYWRAGPEYYLQYADREALKHDLGLLDSFDFIMRLEARYMAGAFPPGPTAFDPHNDDGYSWAERYRDLHKSFVRTLPKKMYEAVEAKS